MIRFSSEIRCKKTIEQWFPNLNMKLNLEFYTQTILERRWKKRHLSTYKDLRQFVPCRPGGKGCPTAVSFLPKHNTDRKRRMQETLDAEIDKNGGNSKYKLA